MSGIAPRAPVGHPAAHRVETQPAGAGTPAVAPGDHEQVSEPGPGHGRLPTLAETGSVALKDLPPQVIRYRWQGRKLRDNTAAGALRDGRLALHGMGAEVHGDMSNWFSARGQTSSQQDSSDNGGSDAAGQLRAFQARELRSLEAQAEAVVPPTHMARHAADLPAICQTHCASHGRKAMPAFLRGTMESLVVDFVRDVADKLVHLEAQAASGVAVPPGDAILPVREACDELLRVMRPIYQRFVPLPQLFSDACTVLCQAQVRLLKEVEGRGEGDTRLRRVMHESVYPLLPIILMGSMPRPQLSLRHRASA